MVQMLTKWGYLNDSLIAIEKWNLQVTREANNDNQHTVNNNIENIHTTSISFSKINGSIAMRYLTDAVDRWTDLYPLQLWTRLLQK